MSSAYHVVVCDSSSSDRFVPKYFESDIDSGMPTLTAEGWKAIEEELGEDGPHALEGFPLPLPLRPTASTSV